MNILQPFLFIIENILILTYLLKLNIKNNPNIYYNRMISLIKQSHSNITNNKQYSMRLIVKKNQPSKFEEGLVMNTHTSKLKCLKQNIVIGRGEQLQEQKNTKVDILTVNHKSISRRHASIGIPYYLAKSSQQLVDNSITIKANQLIPKFLFKLQSIRTIPHDLILKIRQYSSPINAVVITDLNSRFGLYQQVHSIKFVTRPHLYVGTCTNRCKFNDKVIYGQQNKNIVIHLGNQAIKIEDIQQNIYLEQITQYRTKLNQKTKNIQYYIKNIPTPNTNTDSQQPKYWSILLREMPQLTQSDNDPFFCLILSQPHPHHNTNNIVKFSIGRNSCCDVQINRSSISRKQIYMYVDCMGYWVLEDNNSTNGTWLKSNKIIYNFNQYMRNSTQYLTQYTNSQSYGQGYSTNMNMSMSMNMNTNMNMNMNMNMRIGQVQNAYNGLQTIVIKLGQVKFDIQLQNVSTCWNDIISRIKYRQNTNTNINQSYSRILTDISGILQQDGKICNKQIQICD